MSGSQEVRNRIIVSSRELFFRYGFSRVTTDEIAEAAGISKRTLYQYFNSKKELFLEVVEGTLKEFRDRAEALMSGVDRDFLSTVYGLVQLRSQALASIGKPLVEEVRRTFPESWKMVEETRSAFLRSYLRRIIDEGVREGFLLPDLDGGLLERVYSAAISEIVNPESLAGLPYTASQATEAVTRIIFFGVLTERARTELREKSGESGGAPRNVTGIRKRGGKGGRDEG